MIVTVQHMHTVPTWNGRQGYCHGQARAFFQLHGLDWMGFLHNGIEAKVLLATGDARAEHLVQYVMEAEHGQ